MGKKARRHWRGAHPRITVSFYPSRCCALVRKILVVDDEPSILRATALLLEDLGYTVATRQDAADVVAAVETERPDVILHDIHMPRLDVASHFARLRARASNVPIILLTAGFEGHRTAALVRARVLLEKPFTPGELSAAIEEALADATSAQREIR